MSDVAVSVDNISKRYRIGMVEEKSDTMVGSMVKMLKSPITNLRKLKSLRSFKEGEQTDIIWALKDVSFEVKQGESIAIIGKNGAGKSTLLKILSKITDPTSGRAEIHGKVSSLLEVGTGFHPDLTGRENVYLNGTILGMKKVEIDRKFDEIVEFSGVDKFVDTPVKRYSSGMKVRLAFSVAAFLEPEILIIDEVLAVGDLDFQRKCLGKMDQVAKSGRTVLFVSHNMAAVRNLCERGVMLVGGKVNYIGEINEIVSIYEKGMNNSNVVDPGMFPIKASHGYALQMNSLASRMENSPDGATLYVEFELEAFEDFKIIEVFFIVQALDGQLISKVSPKMADLYIKDLNGKKKFVLISKNINHFLASGDFTYSVHIKLPRLVIIQADQIARFEVPGYDSYGYGRFFETPKFGVVPLPLILKEAPL